MSKYHSKKVAVDGHVFDSKKEADRYCELRLLERAGEISNLRLQPRYLLQPAFSCDGNAYRKIEYVADFEYVENGRTVVEDVKGMRTEVYKIKKKLFLMQYGDKYEFRETK